MRLGKGPVITQGAAEQFESSSGIQSVELDNTSAACGQSGETPPARHDRYASYRRREERINLGGGKRVV
jgi:hypothetical protein